MKTYKMVFIIDMTILYLKKLNLTVTVRSCISSRATVLDFQVSFPKSIPPFIKLKSCGFGICVKKKTIVYSIFTTMKLEQKCKILLLLLVWEI